VSTSEGKCVLVEEGALISWCIYSYRIVMLLEPYMWASMTFLPNFWFILANVSVTRYFNKDPFGKPLQVLIEKILYLHFKYCIRRGMS